MLYAEMSRFLRYAVVGVISNVAGYLVYLLATWLGSGPKLTMSVLYAAGATAGYLGNRQWTFAHTGKITPSLIKYGIAHAAGYTINWCLLAYFVDFRHYPHQWVQAAAILVVACFLFITLRFLVFTDES
ncbi:MAG: GtrA family protein [Nitrospira sp.]|nr:GtrA family protein [Nitrospira sp.]